MKSGLSPYAKFWVALTIGMVNAGLLAWVDPPVWVPMVLAALAVPLAVWGTPNRDQ